MSFFFSDGDKTPIDLTAETETLYRETAEELVRIVQAIRAGEFNQISGAKNAVKDLKAAFQLVMDERNKVEKLRKQVAGSVGNLADCHGIVRGFSLTQSGTARSDLQTLTLAYGVDALERDGVVRFQNRTGTNATPLETQALAIHADIAGVAEYTRQAEAETIGRIRLTFVQADADFQTRTVEAVFPDETEATASANEMALTLTSSEARDIAERWLAESRLARDTVRLALPNSKARLGVGDIIELKGARFRIDAMDRAESALVDAVRVQPSLYSPGEEIAEEVFSASVATPVPVFPVFLDLPLLSGDEVPHAPYIATVANPWLGPAALWSAPTDSGYILNRTMDRSAVFGLTQTALGSAPIGVWDRGAPLRVKLSYGSLSSISEADVLAGLNTAAVGDGTADNWEVFQFAQADLVAPFTYDLHVRLRGQAGSDGLMPPTWPSGSQFVLLGPAVPQIDLASSARGVSRHYRVGQANLGYDDQRVTHVQKAFSGNGLRPYRPGHLALDGGLGGVLNLSWIRRTRVDGDSWDQTEVPLGEDLEAYLVRVQMGSTVLREVQVSSPLWTYGPADQTADGVLPGAVLKVAQISDRFGAGPFAEVAL